MGDIVRSQGGNDSGSPHESDHSTGRRLTSRSPGRPTPPTTTGQCSDLGAAALNSAQAQQQQQAKLARARIE